MTESLIRTVCSSEFQRDAAENYESVYEACLLMKSTSEERVN